MSNIGTQILTIMSKNPLHVSYVKTWLKKYAGLSDGQLNPVFTDLYNAYYYFVNQQGYPFPVVDMTTGGMDQKTVALRDSIASMTAYVPSIVNQFLYAIYTGYVQGHLSKDFAFPRDPSFQTADQAAADNVQLDTVKKTATTTAARSKTVQAALTWIPATWQQPAEAKPAANALLSYGIVAALAAGAVWFLSHKKGV